MYRGWVSLNSVYGTNIYSSCEAFLSFLYMHICIYALSLIPFIFSLPCICNCSNILFIYLFVKILVIYFRERRREGEWEGEKPQWVRDRWSVASHTPLLGTWPATQACALTGNWMGDLLVCRPELSPLSHTSQGLFDYFKYILLSVLL